VIELVDHIVHLYLEILLQDVVVNPDFFLTRLRRFDCKLFETLLESPLNDDYSSSEVVAFPSYLRNRGYFIFDFELAHLALAKVLLNDRSDFR